MAKFLLCCATEGSKIAQTKVATTTTWSDYGRVLQVVLTTTTTTTTPLLPPPCPLVIGKIRFEINCFLVQGRAVNTEMGVLPHNTGEFARSC